MQSQQGFGNRPPPPGYGSQPPPGYGGQPPPGYPNPAMASQYGGGYPNPGMSSQAPSPMGTQSYYMGQINQNEMQQLRQWFDAVDKDRSGKISAQELSAMNFGGLRFSPPTATLLIKVFDKDRSGEIDFSEYAALHKFIVSMHQAFLAYDRDRSGTIDLNEAQLAVQQGGFMVSPATMQAIYRKFYVPGSRGLTQEQFLCLCAFLGMCRSAFMQLDYQHTGWVQLSLDQFLMVTSSLV